MATAQTAGPVRLDYDDYLIFTQTHPDGAYELIEGAIYALAPEGDSYGRTRSALLTYLTLELRRDRYTAYSELSFPAPGWADGPRPELLVARGPWLVDGRFAPRPSSREIALVIEVASTSRPKDGRRAELYARLGIPEYWLIDLRGQTILTFAEPRNDAYATRSERVRGERLRSSAVDDLVVEASFVLQLAPA